MTLSNADPLPAPGREHRLADSWRDCVVVCSCGWRTANSTMGKSKVQWVEHAQECHALAEAGLVRNREP